MAEQKTKEELIQKAQLEDLKDPPRNKRGGNKNKDTEKERTHPRSCDLIAGQVYALNTFPRDLAPEPLRDHKTYVGNKLVPYRYAWDYSNDWTLSLRYYFRVRLVCEPIKNSKITLVELISNGALAVIEIEDLRFVPPDGIPI